MCFFLNHGGEQREVRGGNILSSRVILPTTWRGMTCDHVGHRCGSTPVCTRSFVAWKTKLDKAKLVYCRGGVLNKIAERSRWTPRVLVEILGLVKWGLGFGIGVGFIATGREYSVGILSVDFLFVAIFGYWVRFTEPPNCAAQCCACCAVHCSYSPRNSKLIAVYFAWVAIAVFNLPFRNAFYACLSHVEGCFSLCISAVLRRLYTSFF